eukprot:TRINITY_DN16588_c0_g1_i1.p2 TRINITY_DN16588_c0_g1~~TRINITY_DN16588_c0_g1_i1.p2  ORF type:complete len:97 (-),score=24.37 TRINITY_DN16588_c0_g1_i1:121-411(-)
MVASESSRMNMQINLRHPIVKELKTKFIRNPKDSKLDDLTWSLFESSLVKSGRSEKQEEKQEMEEEEEEVEEEEDGRGGGGTGGSRRGRSGRGGTR